MFNFFIREKVCAVFSTVPTVTYISDQTMWNYELGGEGFLFAITVLKNAICWNKLFLLFVFE